VRQTPGAAALLNLCCFLAAEDVPLTLITETAAALDAAVIPTELVTLAKSKRKLDKAIAPLLRYSLATRQDNQLSLHRLVQTVARDQMPAETAQIWLVAAVNLVKNVFPAEHNMLHTWEDGNRLLPHILSTIEQAIIYEVAPETTAYLCNWAGFYLKFLGNYPTARPYYERAVTIGEQHLGTDHTKTAIYLNNLGQLLQDLGDFDAARPFMERALAIDEKALGNDHPDVAIDLNNLGLLLQELGDFDAARPFMERALAIDEKALGPDHPDVAIDLNNLGQLLQDLGDLDAARPYMERALAIFQATLGADHPSTKTVRNNLALLLAEMEDNS
jgi:tetratricopeptide (TPR) repeat protein